MGHPPLFPATSPTFLALCWGIAATLFAGLLLGTILALIADSDGLPPTPIRQVFTLLCGLFAIMAAAASVASVAGLELSRQSIIKIPPGFRDLVPADRHDRFMAVWFAHGTSYLVGLSGSCYVILRLWRARGWPRVISVLPRTKWEFARALILAAAAGWAVWFRFFAD